MDDPLCHPNLPVWFSLFGFPDSVPLIDDGRDGRGCVFLICDGHRIFSVFYPTYAYDSVCVVCDSSDDVYSVCGFGSPRGKKS